MIPGSQQHALQFMRIVNGHLQQQKKCSIPSRDIALQPISGTLTTMENSSYSQGGPQPVQEGQDLQREATHASVAEHQLYLEKLQSELNTLRLWSSGLQDEIMEEAHRVHLQLARMIRELQRSNTPQRWVRLANCITAGPTTSSSIISVIYKPSS